ncbi:MAG: transporter substrate-binding domain-containing protein [Caldicoprobacterales bacterium]|jgi:ABC-type amino acid transport substrate-binding protein|nr:transporter substrate-binding domain-containing protein [Clostridiales bacterium]
MKIKKIFALLMIAVMIFAVTGCGGGDKTADSQMSETMKKIKDSGKIVWGTNAAFAPFEMRSGDEVIGVDAEIAKKIAEKLDVELEVVDMKFEGLINALNSNQIDFIAAGFTIKPDRAEQVLFTDTYFKAVQKIIVQEGNTEIKSAEDLEGKIIGVQTNTTGDFTAKEYTDKIYRFNNAMEAAIDLSNGRLDAVIVDDLPAQMIVAQNEGLVLLDDKAADDEEYALAVRKEATDLKDIINEVLAELKASGAIDEWVEEYSLLD